VVKGVLSNLCWLAFINATLHYIVSFFSAFSKQHTLLIYLLPRFSFFSCIFFCTYFEYQPLLSSLPSPSRDMSLPFSHAFLCVYVSHWLFFSCISLHVLRDRNSDDNHT
jgi:hypothetical protein